MSRKEFVADPGRLDAVVAATIGSTRADVQRAIVAGGVLVDGRARPKSFRLAGGEQIVVDLAEETPLVPERPPVPVVFEDEHLLVVSKPGGLVTHPTVRRRSGTLVNRLLGMGVRLAPAGGELRPGIVHRLDAGTSGLLIVAKNDEAYAELRDGFRHHAIDRRYLALVRGQVPHDSFGVEAPLGRRAAKIVVDRVDGRPATTSFAVRERMPRATLLEAAPETGRTHQIRVHLSAIGYPILGDRAYGGGGDEAMRVGLSRSFLHAWRLRFRHPVTGEQVSLEDPLPEDLADVLARVRLDQRP
ncbi:MAG: RluA family pseudouridine synthase [Actinomycetota bacterium]|nr:RluA family pseudouridine synthase [Actinomycetota bacterium]